ncbi:hypothetical protein [Rhizobium tubonense]|uniref:Uncharacterized protein n=1 Tax=Rhizobium tubonense TaxID=484088 RepID=A0A2W4CRT7_9HYPH|nr:hypothetical protein [Rhizobium tubonense]PZM15397.1 hypothetical protein CPY51_07280 [Rhizobium tubonense]
MNAKNSSLAGFHFRRGLAVRATEYDVARFGFAPNAQGLAMRPGAMQQGMALEGIVGPRLDFVLGNGVWRVH